jgi:hypothetical protein
MFLHLFLGREPHAEHVQAAAALSEQRPQFGLMQHQAAPAIATVA